MEEEQHNERAAHVLRQQRYKMFHHLVTHIRAFSERLGVDMPNFSLD